MCDHTDIQYQVVITPYNPNYTRAAKRPASIIEII